MKKKLLSLTLIIFIIFIFINVFINSKIVTQSISFSINLFVNNIFPSLFPMFILSNILISIGIPEFLGNIFSKISNILFKTKGVSAFVFFMSSLTGFPSSSKYIKELLEKKIIDEVDANKILTWTFFANPLFVINTIGIMFLNNIKYGFLILLAHFLGNLVVGFLFRNLWINNNHEKKISLKISFNNLSYKINNTNIIKEFLKGINNTLIILLNVFGIITCFIIFINLTFFNNSIFKGLIEMTSGLKYLADINIAIELKIYIATFLISFGGFSIHTQIMNILSDYKIKYYPFLLARLIHGAISVLIIYLFINL